MTDDEIFGALATFPGVPGRLEYVGDIEGVKVYNDNNATTPQATIKALEAVGDAEKPNVILLAGGADKGMELVTFTELIPRYCKGTVLLAGTGTDRLKEQVAADVYTDMPTAVNAALSLCAPGDVLLFSPGFASFGLFKNEYDRNDQFVAEISKKIHE